MQSNGWVENFNLAYETYSLAQYNSQRLTSEEREHAALRFINWIRNFKNGGYSAQEVLEANLLSRDPLQRNVAGYILTEVTEAEPLAQLSEALTQFENNQPPLSHQVLKRLWAASPPKNGRELFWKWHLNNIHAHIPLLEALLAKPTTLAYDFAKEILSSGHSKLIKYLEKHVPTNQGVVVLIISKSGAVYKKLVQDIGKTL